MWYIYTTEYYPEIRKGEIMSFAATCIDLGIIILSEVIQTIWYYLYVEYNNDTNELMYETETDSQTYKTYLWLPKGQAGGRTKLGFGD